MGKTIERLAKEQGHEIAGIIDIDVTSSERQHILNKGDVAIEFSHPDAAAENIKEALNCGIPVVSGTTGWLTEFESIKSLTNEMNGSFFYASNFSIGVNIFFAINERLATLMNGFPEYEVQIDETHHIHKKDAPSGTAITLAEGVINQLDRKENWQLEKQAAASVPIYAHREGEVYGKHVVRYQSEIDTIEIMHDAHTRDGFALGAITAAKWLIGREGVFSMKDMMGL